MGPHSQQPGQQVLVLGQLHLEPPLPGAGPLGKDVQDQGGAVHHSYLQFLAEHPLLGGGQAVVKNHHIRVHCPDQLPDLRHLALADEGAGVGAVLGLEDGPHALASRRLQQVGQLIELHRAPVDIDQHDHREHILHDVLRNVNDIDLMLIQRVRNLGNDARAVLADHRDDCAHSYSSR